MLLNYIIKDVLSILVLASVSNGIKYDGLRVKFGVAVDYTGNQNFISIPRTVTQAKDEGWKPACRPHGRMPELVLYCAQDYALCGLYTSSGAIAGLQIAVPKASVPQELKPERYFIEWTPEADGPVYWTATQEYVTEEFLKAGGPTPGGAILQAGGVWFNDLDGNVIKMPLDEKEVPPHFTKQLCVPNMGVHYYYNVSREFDCSTIFLPFYGLFSDGELAGVGFQTYGRVPSVADGCRQWFEDLPPQRDALKSYVFRFPVKFKETLLAPEFWPEGIVFRRFREARPKPVIPKAKI